MRLVRRLTDSIRSHDWFFVVVDVLVLVLGLVLAFQVDRWWEHRRERREERVFLEHLWDDARLNVIRLQRLEGLHTAVVTDLARVHAAADDPAALRPMEEASGAGCALLIMPAARLSNTAYQELLSSNKLGVIRDRELKLRLSRAMASHGFVAGQLGYFRDASSTTTASCSRTTAIASTHRAET